ncbi:MAG: hypothetical protein NTV21_20720 [Planctomycetota bacterium]|nr:hypothetical protein [Planctomycetota bacterium]
MVQFGLRSLGCLLLVAIASAGPRAGDGALAPDGKRGFGPEASLTETLAIVRATHEADQQFLKELDGLPSEVEVLSTAALERYRQRGYLKLVERSKEASLALVHAELKATLEHPFEALGDGARGELAAKLVCDVRLRLRARVLANLVLPTKELHNALAVLRGATNGLVLLSTADVRCIAVRADLAASELRALRSDLLALRQSGGEAEIDTRAQGLIDLVRASEGEPVRRAGLERELAELQALEDGMAASLFSERLRTEQHELFEWRQRLFEESVPLRDEALLWLPDGEQPSKPPRDVERLSKSERMRGAGARSFSALALDPLDVDACWVAAHSSDFIYGITESRTWYDRFLALRGIRAHDHRTYADRKLDAREREALDAVQRALLGPGSGQPTNPPVRGQ